MSVQDMLREAQKLSLEERKELVKALVDTLIEPAPQSQQRVSLRSFRGIGAHLYDGTDAQDHVDQLRSEWDDHS